MKTLIFLGTPPMAAKLLEMLIQNDKDIQIIGVVTQPDRPVGRKKILTPSPVAEIAEKYNIPLHKPERLNKDYTFIEEKNPDILLTFAYGQLVSEKILSLPKYPALNLHGSLLPKYRGAAPLQYALMNGEKKTGISLMQMVIAMDAGPVFAVEEFPIEEEDDYTALTEKMTQCAYKTIIKHLPDFIEGKLPPVPQDETKVTFCPSIKPEEEHLDLNKDKISFINHIRSLSQTPGGFLLMADNSKFKIYKAHIVNDDIQVSIGTIIKAKKNDLVLQLKDGQINLDIVQISGKSKMEASVLNNGRNLEGEVLR